MNEGKQVLIGDYSGYLSIYNIASRKKLRTQ